MKSFSNETLSFFLEKVLGLLDFGSCQNCMTSTKLVAEIHQKIWKERTLSSGEPCICEYATLLKSFHRGALSIHRYIAQNLQRTFFMSVLFRSSFKTAIFRRFLKVDTATSSFINEFYKAGFATEFSVSMFLCSCVYVLMHT